MNPKIHRFILTKILGWTYTDGLIPEDKAVVLAAPHTSIWDLVIGWLYYRSLGGHIKVMIKKEAFFFPVAPILRAFGAFPIDRKHAQGTVISLIHELEKADKTILVICPEGTRKAVRKWKTGYHTIARATGLPVYLAYFDFKKKIVGRGEKFTLTDDARGDTDRIQRIYKEMNLTALHPEGYTTE